MPSRRTPSARGWRRFVAGMALYAPAIVVATIAVRLTDPRIAALLWGMGGWLAAVRSFDELGRRVFAEAAAVTLAVVLAAALTHGLLRAYVGIPPLDGFVVVAFGGFAYGLASAAAAVTADGAQPPARPARRTWLVAGRAGAAAGRQPPDVNAIETGKYDPSLPLAFALGVRSPHRGPVRGRRAHDAP
jgi:hypothetical protein